MYDSECLYLYYKIQDCLSTIFSTVMGSIPVSFYLIICTSMRILNYDARTFGSWDIARTSLHSSGDTTLHKRYKKR